MNWKIEDGKIKADGRVQDTAIYLWTLENAGNDVFATRALIVDARRLPALRNVFGDARTVAENTLKQLGTTRVQLVANRQPCVPAEFRAEVGQWLRAANQSRLADFLGV